jgi:predicted alpha/beta hydrolase family esterase
MFGRKPSANSQPNEDSNMTGLMKISGCDNPSRRGDVVFVHGLAGHAWDTWHWQNPEDKNYQKDNFWLTWLGKDLDVGIWTFGYSAARLRANGSAMPLFDQASNFLDDLENFGIGERPVVFVTHSMGGLLVKKMLNAAKTFSRNKSKEAVLKSTQGIIFLSTPHLGSDVAQWVKSLAGFLTTVNVEELQAHAPQLRELDEWYRQTVDELGIQTKVYYETKPTSGVLIVTASSANPGIKDVKPIAVEANHDSIAKPHPGDSKVYLGVKKFIIECLPSENQKSLPPAANLSPLPQQMNNINQNIQASSVATSVQGDAIVNNNHYYNSENPQQPL